MSQVKVGIMTLYINQKNQIEERPYFRRCIEVGHKLGLDVFVFTPQDVIYKSRKVYAHVFDLKRRHWMRRWMQVPEIIFDRCRYQPTPRFQQLKLFRKKFPNLKYLNRPLANKWVIHQLFHNVKDLRKHLPATLYYQGKEDLVEMLKKYRTVYLKPINGTGGRGILKVQRKEGGRLLVEGRNPSRKMINRQVLSLSRISQLIQSWSSKRSYLVQQGIDLTLSTGRVHDYRLLIQKNGQGKWEYTGCAGRIGAKRSITSNLHGGGRAASLDHMLSHWFSKAEERETIKKAMKDLSFKVVDVLDQRFGQLCELALDLAIDRSGHIWLLEINPKPGRQVFTKIGERSTYDKAISRPLEYALWMSKQWG